MKTAKAYPDSNLDEIRDLAEEMVHASGGPDDNPKLYERYLALSGEDLELLSEYMQEIKNEETCQHSDLDPMEGCLDCGKAYHEIANMDPDLDLER